MRTSWLGREFAGALLQTSFPPSSPEWIRTTDLHFVRVLPWLLGDRTIHQVSFTAEKVRGEGIEPSLPGSEPGGLPLADPQTEMLAPANDSRRQPSCGGRNRTCDGAVNSRLPVPTRDPPQRGEGRGTGGEKRGKRQCIQNAFPLASRPPPLCPNQDGWNRTSGLVRPRHAE
jgi:hypothetical protein